VEVPTILGWGDEPADDTSGGPNSAASSSTRSCKVTMPQVITIARRWSPSSTGVIECIEDASHSLPVSLDLLQRSRDRDCQRDILVISLFGFHRKHQGTNPEIWSSTLDQQQAYQQSAQGKMNNLRFRQGTPFSFSLAAISLPSLHVFPPLVTWKGLEHAGLLGCNKHAIMATMRIPCQHMTDI